MFIGPRRAVLIGTIAAVALTIILLPLIFALTSPDLDLVTVRLDRVALMSVEDEGADLRTSFVLENPTDQTATTSRIDFELFADGTSLGPHTISYDDIPVNGRPAIFGKDSVTVSETFTVKVEDAGLLKKISDNPETIKWRAKGIAQIESTLTLVEKPFENEI
ncbi:MAG: hypothetical protein ACREAY_11215 [Nitrososphaera sp.]|uniref:hypothetical protein n=1 Tax=Nitrososphaera sp. TaxID=1971748 RepID=UPI003D700484